MVKASVKVTRAEVAQGVRTRPFGAGAARSAAAARHSRDQRCEQPLFSVGEDFLLAAVLLHGLRSYKVLRLAKLRMFL